MSNRRPQADNSVNIMVTSLPSEDEIAKGMLALERVYSEQDYTADHSGLHARLRRAGHAFDEAEFEAVIEDAKKASKKLETDYDRPEAPKLSDLPEVEGGLFIGSIGQRISQPFPHTDVDSTHLRNTPPVDVDVHEAGLMTQRIGPAGFQDVKSTIRTTVGVAVSPPAMIPPVCRMDVTPKLFNKWSTTLTNWGGPPALSEGKVRLAILEYSNGIFRQIAFLTGWEELWSITLSPFQRPHSAEKADFVANPYTPTGSADVSFEKDYLIALSARVRVQAWGPHGGDDVSHSDVSADLVAWNAFFDVEFDRCRRPPFRIEFDF